MMRVPSIAVLVLALAACAGPQAPAQNDRPAAQQSEASSTDTSSTSMSDEPSPGIPHGETGGMCGGIAGFQCLNEGDFCAFDEGVCSSIADGAGTCQPRPEACTQQYDPVCGCDGKTYGNACAAAASGVSVASRGECAPQE